MRARVAVHEDAGRDVLLLCLAARRARAGLAFTQGSCKKQRAHSLVQAVAEWIREVGAAQALDELDKLAATPDTSGYLDCTLAQLCAFTFDAGWSRALV